MYTTYAPCPLPLLFPFLFFLVLPYSAVHAPQTRRRRRLRTGGRRRRRLNDAFSTSPPLPSFATPIIERRWRPEREEGGAERLPPPPFPPPFPSSAVCLSLFHHHHSPGRGGRGEAEGGWKKRHNRVRGGGKSRFDCVRRGREEAVWCPIHPFPLFPLGGTESRKKALSLSGFRCAFAFILTPAFMVYGDNMLACPRKLLPYISSDSIEG